VWTGQRPGFGKRLCYGVVGLCSPEKKNNCAVAVGLCSLPKKRPCCGGCGAVLPG